MGSLTIIKCSTGILLKNLLFTENSNSLFNNIFGKFNLESKDFDTIIQQSIFIFINQMWSNVVLNFKINKVDISGGSISKRHILHTVDYQLVLFLLNIFDESKIPNIVYNSYKNSLLSSSIPLDLYNKYINMDISNIKGKDSSIYEAFALIKGNSHVEIIKNNFVLSINMLINDITNGIKNELEKLNKTLVSYSSQLALLSHEVSKIENIGSVSTKHMSNKDKKKFKNKTPLK